MNEMSHVCTRGKFQRRYGGDRRFEDVAKVLGKVALLRCRAKSYGVVAVLQRLCTLSGQG